MTHVARSLFALVLCAGALLTACTFDAERRSPPAVADIRCPEPQRGEWQQLADRIDTALYCPSWLPDPLVNDLHHPSVDGDRSYQIGFHDSELRSAETHVVLAAYPSGRPPRCEDLTTGVYGPCWKEPSGLRQVAGFDVTVYERGLGHESQHLVYAWTEAGVLYSASNHIDRRPNSAITRAVAQRNLSRILRGLDRIEPRGAAGTTEDEEHEEH